MWKNTSLLLNFPQAAIEWFACLQQARIQNSRASYGIRNTTKKIQFTYSMRLTFQKKDESVLLFTTHYNLSLKQQRK